MAYDYYPIIIANQTNCRNKGTGITVSAELREKRNDLIV